MIASNCGPDFRVKLDLWSQRMPRAREVISLQVESQKEESKIKLKGRTFRRMCENPLMTVKDSCHLFKVVPASRSYTQMEERSTSSIQQDRKVPLICRQDNLLELLVRKLVLTQTPLTVHILELSRVKACTEVSGHHFSYILI